MEVTGNAGSWSEELLHLTMVNTLDQWVEETARYRGEEEPSLHDLVFTKKLETPPSDHVTLVLEMQREDVIRYREDYK
ncbi:hypothetical protein E2C01_082644 [Portunus trituberculatus]|uniref:Uncharacterized protein n=1 Tax=Portunus trituberculatus TaxID=210409 RepID=A0A5B7IQH2_PORTR|nr:hypothetical protein [Portunus trituberculatus]